MKQIQKRNYLKPLAIVLAVFLLRYLNGLPVRSPGEDGHKKDDFQARLSRYADTYDLGEEEVKKLSIEAVPICNSDVVNSAL